MLKQTKWIDSAPAWAWGPRPSNPKFGGGLMVAGIPLVVDRLIAVKGLTMKLGLSEEDEVRSSGHVLHEIKTGMERYKKFNSPQAISFRELQIGIRGGKTAGT
jgi:hypothetical protein